MSVFPNSFRQTWSAATLLAACLAALSGTWGGSAWAQNWNGSTSTDFFDSSNWSGGDPGAGSSFTIEPGANNAIYNGAGPTYNNVNINGGGVLTMSGGTFTSTGQFSPGNSGAAGVNTFNMVSGSMQTGRWRTSVNTTPVNTVTASINISGGNIFANAGAGTDPGISFADAGSSTPVQTTFLLTGGTLMTTARIRFGSNSTGTTGNPLNSTVTGTIQGGLMSATNLGNMTNMQYGTLQFSAGRIVLEGGILRGTDLSNRNGIVPTVVTPDRGVYLRGGVLQIDNTGNENQRVYTIPAGGDPATAPFIVLQRGAARASNGFGAFIFTTATAGSTQFTTEQLNSSENLSAMRWIIQANVMSDSGTMTTRASMFASNIADFNVDGVVDQSDANFWETQLGNTYTASNLDPQAIADNVYDYYGADGNGDGIVTQEDYDVWSYRVGQRTAGGVYAFAQDQTINVGSGSQTQAGAGFAALTFMNTRALTKTGAGELVLDGSNSYTYPTTVSAGTLRIANSGAFTLASSTVTVQPGATLKVESGVTMMSPKVAVAGTLDGTGATISVNAKTGIRRLEIGSGGNVVGSPSMVVSNTGSMVLSDTAAPQTVNVASLSVDTATGGKVDLGRGMVNIAAGSAVDLVADILVGRGDGSWNGTSGITSSAAAASGGGRTVGWLDNGGGSLTVAFAAAGDTNLDWFVDILDAADFLAADKYDEGSAATWKQGDFNYDGIVDILDAAEFTSTGLFDDGLYNGPSPAAGSIAAVPEPASTGVAVGVTGLLVAWRLRRRTT